ncbi:hypothetical protein AOZ06_08490 [Kibdelosporangium phytohabitans]|uniref:Uncharacterized protein n=2 Tax=Kibdelosporangium phytohabitans TaxID=860235 RepID=A0A0N9HXK3_9PSEU|nr:hypothetical protein AOZ06_08490 [Kibdelosporangium phytohabitans]
MVEGHDGPSTVIVGAVGVNSYVEECGVDSLESITRLVSTADIQRAQAAVEEKLADQHAAETIWLAHCRWVAGIDASEPADPLPAGFDIPPLPTESEGSASADQHGSGWWRAYKKAEELQRSEAEIARFSDIARSWFRIRDASTRAEQVSSVKIVAHSADFARVIRDVASGADLGDQPGHLLGKPMWDWLRYAEELSKADEPETSKALPLVYALIVVAEKEATISGREPAPAYTERAAILHRKRKEYSQEVAVLERWEKACPPERRGPGAQQSKLARRLTKARELANKHT